MYIKKTFIFIEYVLVRLLYFVVNSMPQFVCRAASRGISLVVGNLLNYRANVINHNLNIAFPNLKNSEKDKIKSDFYDYFSYFFLNFIKASSFDEKFFKQNIRVHNADCLKNLSNTGFILVSGHVGDFSLFAMVTQSLINAKDNFNVILREQSNPMVNKFYIKQRRACGQKYIYTDGALKKAIKALNKNEIIYLLNDQNGKDKGCKVDFFQKEASSMVGLPIMHLKTGAPIYQGYCIMSEDGKYDYFVEKLEFDHSDDQEQLFKNILKSFNKNLETAINKNPNQYFWSHKRWPIDYSEKCL